jgi:hypothetical protein
MWIGFNWLGIYHENKYSVLIKGMDILGQLSDYQFLKNDFAARSKLAILVDIRIAHSKYLYHIVTRSPYELCAIYSNTQTCGYILE